MAERIPAGLSASAGRKFGVTVGVAFLALAALFWWRQHATPSMVLGGLGALLSLAGLAIPTKLGPVERAWMAMAHAISKVTTPIVMGIVYYLVVLPIGLGVRLLGRNPIVHAPQEGSFWVQRDAERNRTSDLKHQF